MPDTRHTLRLAFPSQLDMLDLVQLVVDHAGRAGNLDDDSLHSVSVSVRESVVNAIKHGNGGDETKQVVVEFQLEPRRTPARLVVRVMDQGQGFTPVDVPDPRAPENLLKSCGRGLLLMRCFMDRLTWRRAPGGGTEVRMVKKLG